MKAPLFGIATILVSAEAYIDEHTAFRPKSSPFATTDWSPKSFAPRPRINPLGEPAITDDRINVDSNVEGIIRREYSAWAVRHGKVKNDERFEIFKKNFVVQMEMNRKNGEFFLLNKFGDLTKDEFIALSKESNEFGGKGFNGVETRNKPNLKFSELSATLPSAHIPQIEDLTRELLESVLDSSRRYVAEERNAFIQKERSKTTKVFIDNTVHQEGHFLTRNQYARLIDSVVRNKNKKFRDKKIILGSPGSSTIRASYIHHLYTPMQPLDNFVRSPVFLSAAMTSVSETIQTNLIEKVDFEWEECAYAMNFGDYFY
mmetsp:Transcript_20223/g.41484  ORF Transcript_20223/g.41484 Transcript_20223/m.41484 type:complete len:316 (+) Transcript_20223:110-1057(+)